MNGLLVLLVLVAIAIGLLRVLGLRPATLMLAGAALMLGAAGYALQGRPNLSGSSTRSIAEVRHIPLARARHVLLGQFTSSERWMILADSYASRGKTQEAVGLVQSGLRAHPDDYTLWVGLGNALVDHAGMMTPAAELAYRRAATLAPTSPAPPFFYGLGLLRSGQREEGLAQWKSLLASAPAGAEWRTLVEEGVAMLERGQAGS